MEKSRLKNPFISKINHEKYQKLNRDTIITISGNWPNPNWSFVKTEIKYIVEDREVHINYLGVQASGISIQVLKSFSDRIILNFSENGVWKIIIKGRSQKWESIIIISE